MTAMERSGARNASNSTELRSSRWVTSGYRNVFHRAFLYGMGLSEHDLHQPFAGLAVAHNEAVPGQAVVKALGDVVKRNLTSAGFTERQFTVPSTRDTPDSSVASRELTADSVELAVRGHWYDVVVGVAASVPAVFGVAQAIYRLSVPGVVAIPAERVATDGDLATAAGVLESLGVGIVVSLDDDVALVGAFEALNTRMRLEMRKEVDIAARRAAFVSSLPPAAMVGSLLAHTCSLAHEIGVSDLSQFVGRALRRVEIRTRSGLVQGLCSTDVPIASFKKAVPGSTTIQGTDGRTLTVVAADRHGWVSEVEADEVLVVPLTLDQVQIASHPSVSLSYAAAPGDAVFPTAGIAGCDHPGYVDSALNYNRL
ncbi:Dihydroxy-acid dehydratase (plasmid) [Rhodococcus ruber]|uniref:dihydroxy-acid dehydratase domain-containing protein n=1 Tax=Rhodococcus ruber TaxID=1830 RepID=UPI00315CD5F1